MLHKVLLQACIFAVSFVLVQSRKDGETVEICPNGGLDDNGYWNINEKEGVTRCILRCYDGFEPSSCHVLRKKLNGDWNYDVPVCVKEKWITIGTVGKAVGAVAAGAGAVAAAPVVLSAAGFTTAGVAAGSVAAGLQGSAVAAGSWFAALQSAGAAGLAATTKGAIFGGISTVTGAVSSLFAQTCESE